MPLVSGILGQPVTHFESLFGAPSRFLHSGSHSGELLHRIALKSSCSHKTRVARGAVSAEPKKSKAPLYIEASMRSKKFEEDNTGIRMETNMESENTIPSRG